PRPDSGRGLRASWPVVFDSGSDGLFLPRPAGYGRAPGPGARPGQPQRQHHADRHDRRRSPEDDVHGGDEGLDPVGAGPAGEPGESPEAVAEDAADQANRAFDLIERGLAGYAVRK
ncbi:hypothetical protein ACFWA1_36975, partial [Streptomyces sp. NPDC060005]